MIENAYQPVTKKIQNPFTLKTVNEVKIGEKVFRWNSVWKTYNNVKNNELLYMAQLKKIVWDKQ
jgi:hypothetical protein